VRSTSAAAQGSIFERLGIDKLQLRGLGAQVGRIGPSQVDPTNLYAINADYGEITPHWRVAFGVSYWESAFNSKVVQTLVDTLNRSLVDSAGGAHLQASRISVYDVTFSGSLRWMPTGATVVRPYVDAGIAAHVLNAEGKLIKGTFVERSLDQIAAGFFTGVGVQLRPYGRVGLDGTARVDLLSGFRSAQLRAGIAYELGPPRRLAP
jgi:hypothetical protein